MLDAKTPESYWKAYQLLLSVSSEIDVKKGLQELEIICRDLNHVETLLLAEKIQQFSSTYDFATLYPGLAKMREVYLSRYLSRCSLS